MTAETLVYYRHLDTGDRGYLVTKDGKQAIRYDRGPHVEHLSMELKKWKKEVDDVPTFNEMQVAQVCFAADKRMCWALGLHDLASREWMDLSDKQRVRWMKDGPPEKYLERRRVFEAIRSAMVSK